MTLRSLSASDSWRGVKSTGVDEMGLGTQDEDAEDVQEEEEQETGPSGEFILWRLRQKVVICSVLCEDKQVLDSRQDSIWFILDRT